MEGTNKAQMTKLLDKAWDEDSARTLKLIFYLGDVRRGLGASNQFHVSTSIILKLILCNVNQSEADGSNFLSSTLACLALAV